ncbi:MAG TPA: O-antigen ligase family protein [Candidatus Deferrimicrobium sp.]|nr:O-antigen ligase family protein [Candidatus Deferrimicrobium sp.]
MANERKEIIQARHLWWIALIGLSVIAGLVLPHVKPLFPLVGILLLVNVIVVVKYPFWGVLLYLIVFLFRPGEVYPSLAAMRIELVLGAFVLVVTILHQKVKTGKMTLPVDKITLALAAFLIAMFLSSITSYEKTQTLETCKDFLKTLIFYYLIVAIIDTRRKFAAFVIVYAAMIGKIAVDAYRSYIAGGFIHTMGVDRLAGTTSAGGDPNSLAATMAISIPLVIAGVIYFKNTFVKVGLLALSAGMTYLIMITGSRGGLLSFVGVLCGGFLYTRHKLVAIFSVCILAVGLWTILPEQYRTRYETLVDVDDANEVSSGRVDIWKAGLKMIVGRPITGVGAGAFQWAAASGSFGYGRFMQPHNLVIQILATTGIVGFAAWSVFFVNLVRRLRELKGHVLKSPEHRWVSVFGKGFVVSLIGLGVAGLFGHNLYRYNWYMIAGLTVALFSLVSREKENAAAETAPEVPSKALAK